MSVTVKTKIQWRKDVLEKVVGRQEKALVAAGFQLESYIKTHFTSTKGGGKMHVPSSPGRPPAVDTGRLRASISTNWTNSGMTNGKTETFSTITKEAKETAYKKNVQQWIKNKASKKNIAKYKAKIGKVSLEADGIGDPGGNKIDPFHGGKFKVVVGTNVEYGPSLEFGTVNMAARPFMRPAYDFNRNKITKMMARNK